ncbi:hypothetical protein CRV24_006235 [Beauveria bassiana]|nr:hypothetical protein CRV24_006235 [Beauveria bassiana]KAH8708762.1 hypothetical protein HC256_008702 [Beauveria bassiana]
MPYFKMPAYFKKPDYRDWPEEQQLRWCDNQIQLIDAALEAEDYLTALHFCDVALERIGCLGRDAEAAVWYKRAKIEYDRENRGE